MGSHGKRKVTARVSRQVGGVAIGGVRGQVRFARVFCLLG